MTECPAHRFDVRVYYEDTDSGGIVYYANYLKFAERARTEMLRDVGIDHGALLENDGLAFAVRRCNTEYLSPARLDDALHVISSITGMGGASIDMNQTVMRDHNTLCVLGIKLACMRVSGEKAGRPQRIPHDIVTAMARFAA